MFQKLFYFVLNNNFPDIYVNLIKITNIYIGYFDKITARNLTNSNLKPISTS